MPPLESRGDRGVYSALELNRITIPTADLLLEGEWNVPSITSPPTMIRRQSTANLLPRWAYSR